MHAWQRERVRSSKVFVQNFRPKLVGTKEGSNAKRTSHLSSNLNAAIFLIKKRSAERLAAIKNEEEPPEWYTKKEMRHKVYGLKNRTRVTPGMKNRAEHIVSKEQPKTTEKLYVPYWFSVALNASHLSREGEK